MKFKNRNIHFVSDSHFFHANICASTTKWTGDVNKCRDFESLEAMNDAIVNNINDVVGVDDVLFHLGDWSFGGKDKVKMFRDRIKCKEVHLIFGNHDHHITNKKKGLQELFASVAKHRNIYIDGQMVVLCHFAHRVWDKSHDGTIMLYGHSHGTLPGYGKSMDVGIDAHPEFRPFSWEEIKELMDKEDILFVDHHNEKTEHQPKH